MANGSIDLGNMSMLDLFRIEADGQSATIERGLLQLEQQPAIRRCLEQLMRAAHSIKGAARMVDIDSAVQLAHAMEDCFVAAQQGTISLGADQIDCLLKGVDALKTIASTPADELSDWFATTQSQLDVQLVRIGRFAHRTAPSPDPQRIARRSARAHTDQD